jgi:hypothetical protein
MLKTFGLAILGLSATTLLAGNNGGQGQSDADNLVTTLCQQASEGSPSCPGNKYGTPNGNSDPNTVRVYIADARARTLTGEETLRTVTFVEDSEQETSGNYVDPATGEIDGKFSHRITFTSLDYTGEATFRSQLTLKVEYTVPEGDVELNGSTAKTGCIHTFSRLTGNSGDTLADIINE